MAKAVIMGGGGGGVSSDELTAARGDVLKGKDCKLQATVTMSLWRERWI